MAIGLDSAYKCGFRCDRAGDGAEGVTENKDGRARGFRGETVHYGEATI
jgi:hypothetical protein